MVKERISLDVESVLTNIMDPFFEQYNNKHGTDYTRSDMEDWDWIPRELDIGEFLSMTEEQWKTRAFDEIPPEEIRLSQSVSALSSRYPVDVVTSRNGCDDAIQDWLEHHNITSYNRFISNMSDKTQLEYKYYIDDNPKMANKIDDDQVLFLVDRSWNGHAEGSNVVRVPSVAEVLNYI